MNEQSFLQKMMSSIREIMITLIIAFAIFFVINIFVQIGRVSGSSMEDTYHDGEIVLINKVQNDFERNKIIIFTYTTFHEEYYEELYDSTEYTASNTDDELGEYHVKRVRGVPGDKVEIKNGVTSINGKFISKTSIIIPDQEYILGDNEYFVCGDNVDHSFDSRQHGPIMKNDIIGEVFTDK